MSTEYSVVVVKTPAAMSVGLVSDSPVNAPTTRYSQLHVQYKFLRAIRGFKDAQSHRGHHLVSQKLREWAPRCDGDDVCHGMMVQLDFKFKFK